MAYYNFHSLFTFSIIIISTFFITINGGFSEETIPMKRMEKMSHLHFYFHDILSGKNPSAVLIARAKNSTGVGFGNTMMIDDSLTEGPEADSKLVGRAQGLYALASRHDVGMLMVMNFEFIEGKYNGSVLSIMGRNPVLNPVREMPIVGGSGLFRFARGYALAHTLSFDIKTGDAIVEYNVFVLHY
ncbi:hypothetical protein HHK36_017828 [Tetracentron sinense]|uniref:Dirigent protein n=1 Tax=Tetracentron sinense TaxID=13715 RepID=A0A834YXH3_TETSI|nr:hypothetical protein HHK36_017828 [Tetracentron sinense]